MHAIIPVAGKGTRLRPHTYSTPKALLPVAGRPILGHIIDRLIEAGIERLTLIVGHLGDQIVEWTKNRYDLPVDFAVQESMDGLAAAVLLASPWCDDSRTMVVLGDTIFEADLSSLRSDTRNIIGVRRVEDPERFGVVVMEGERVVRLVEKPAEYVSDIAIVGIYCFNSGSELMNACSRLVDSGRRTKGEFQLTDAMQNMLAGGEEFGTFQVERWFDCGNVETMLETNRVILDANPPEISHELLRDSIVIPPCFISADAKISSSVIGPYASIGPESIIERSVVSDIIVGSRSRITSAMLEHSLVGNGVVIEGHLQSLNTGDNSVIEL